VSREGPHLRPYKARRRRPLRALLHLALPLRIVTVGQTSAASCRRCWSPDSMHRSIAEASRPCHVLRLVVLHVCRLSSSPEDQWKVARTTPPVCLQSTTAGLPSSKSGASRQSPPVVSTSLRSPRSPLSVLRLARAPSCLEPWRFERPRSSCRPRPSLYVPIQRRKKTPCFVLRPLAFLVIFRSVLCLDQSIENPLRKSHLSHINHACAFYRSNPVLCSFREHYLMCLGNLFC
jgi:hypothetical protein